ncbi:helix-turn-helix transcriptional regulator [Sandaracinobacter sp. RS1-74]|uniref:AraC family transcriptional regulator n=1 Tax=Sandaracinobacteroides sayramensis TaxID=2913411 RepID=UPI001EDC56AA|nr:helix-turn-helix transcriptional regulator [Sandaracinobacteroides sayramensis]MCG2842629.1 helix-turn-helix transcriptional regulator [Sandaracinobacteroides sayramensis]
MKHSSDILGSDRPVLALHDEYPAGFVDPMHRHRHVQILYACTGIMAVRTARASYVVPPNRALWIPSGVDHEVRCRSAVSLRTLYLRPDDLPPNSMGGAAPSRVFEVSALLRALILEMGELGTDYPLEGRAGHVVSLLLDEIDRIPGTRHELSMPGDPRLLRVCGSLLEHPSDPRDIDEWARVAGMGRRTFTRSFKRETGVGFAMWRQQARLMEAMALLASGTPIAQVAFEVGYDSPSSFSAMFRRAFGVSPSRYS